MSLRNRWRLVNRLVKAFTVFDSMPRHPAVRSVLFSCHDVDRSMVENGLRYSPLLEGIEDIVAELGHDSVRLSHPFSVFRSEAVKGGAITVNYRAMAIRLRVFLLRLVAPAKRDATRSKLEQDLYGSILAALRPALVFSIQPPEALCLAARAHGIKVVEAMHGTNISANDRIIGAHMALPAERLPHTMLTFDPVSQVSLSSMCAGKETRVCQADDPWLHRLRRLHAADARDEREPKGVKRVLLTLQWGYDGERDSLSNIIPNGVVHPAIVAAMAATEGRGIEFHIRLHPIQMNAPGYRHHRRFVETLVRRHPHVSFERATRMPLPILLDEMSAHLTMSSSSVGEAAVAGVPTLLLCPTLHRGGAHDGMFRELEADGLATFGRLDADGILKWIDAQPLLDETNRKPYDLERMHQAQLGFYSRLLEGALGAVAAPAREQEAA